MGRRFQEGFTALAERLGVPARALGYPVHPKIVVEHRSPERQRLLMSLFLQETAARGAIFHFAGFNVSFSHSEADVDRTLAACGEALRIVGDAAGRRQGRRAASRQAVPGSVQALVSTALRARLRHRAEELLPRARPGGRRRAPARVRRRVLARLGAAAVGHEGLRVSRLDARVSVRVPDVIPYQGRADLLARLDARPPDAVIALAPPPRPRALPLDRRPVHDQSRESVRGGWLSRVRSRRLATASSGSITRSTISARPARSAPATRPRWPRSSCRSASRRWIRSRPSIPRRCGSRLGLPANRPVVVYLPYPIKSNPPTFWLRHVYGPSSRVRRAVAVAATGKRRYWPHVSATGPTGAWSTPCGASAIGTAPRSS